MLREVIQGLPGGARNHPPVEPSAPTPHIAILGTGFGGLGMAIRLRQAGITSFTIYEKADRVGGTWRDNTYPGAECDVPSHLYSLSFAPKYDWSRHYPEQPEILAYLEDCVDRFELRSHIRFGTEIAAARYDDRTAEWRLETTTGEELVADVLVCGLGQLNRPAVPDIAGLSEFEGAMFHSARWDHDHPLEGESVAVIGNGASAVQFVPRIAPVTGHLTIFQRSANWVMPKQNPPFAERTKAMFARMPWLDRAYRASIYLQFESRFFWFRRSSRFARLIEKVGKAYREREVADPVLREQLTPDYPIGCKRILAVSDYYSTLVRDDVEVVSEPIERISRSGVVTADGRERPVDVIILATGFESTDFLAPIDIVGRDGRKLDEAWRDGAEAYLGMAVSGFPNLFMLYGPNTNLGHNSIVFMLERQISYVLQCVQEMVAEGVAALDVRPDVMAGYNRTIQRRMRGMVWEAGCSSWYKTDSGKVTNNWPTFTVEYWLATRHPRFDAFESAMTSPIRATEVWGDWSRRGQDLAQRFARSRFALPGAFLGLFAFGLVVHFPIFTSPVLDVDEATVGSIAQEILRGRHLYEDLVDRKPPIVFLIYAASFLMTHGDSLLPVRMLMVGLEAATGLLIGWALCVRWRHRLAIAALFLLGTAAFPLADAHAASFEGFMVLPMTVAWWFSRKGRALPAAVALALATLVKQSAVFTIIPIAYNLWRGPNGPRRVAVMATGAVGLYLLVGTSFGLKQFLFWNLTGNASYLGASSLLGLAGRALLTLAVYAVGHVVLVWLAGRAWVDRREHLDLWLWLVSALVGVAIGQHFFGHYYLQVLPPLAALAATQIDRVPWRRALQVAVAVTAVWLGVSVVVPRPDLPPYVRLVAQIDRLSDRDDPILVWGVFSEATWASARPMASRFPHTNFVTGVDQGRPTQGALEDLCQDIEARAPTLIIDTSPANVRDSGKAPMVDVPAMVSVLSSYRRQATIDGMVIYKLVQPAASCGTASRIAPPVGGR